VLLNYFCDHNPANWSKASSSICLGGGRDDKNPPPKEDRRTVEISPEGFYVIAKASAFN